MNRARRHQRGYVFLKGNGWYLRYYDYVVAPDGVTTLKIKCTKLASFGGPYRSKKSVRRLADEFLKPLNNGTQTPESDMTVAAFVDQVYLPWAKEQKKPSTYDGYLKMWKGYLKDRMAMPLREFRTVDCETLLTALVRARKQGKDKLGIRTMAHLKHLLSGIFRYAIRTGYLNGVNPVRDAVLPAASPASKTHAYSIDEITNMLENVPPLAQVVIATAAFTGLRKGELRGLEVSDYAHEALIVHRNVWRKEIGTPKGKRGQGAVPVIPWLAQLLDGYIAAFKPRKYLFEGLKRGPADLDYLTREVIKPALTKAGITWHGWHAFRRGLATNLHRLGVADIVIQAILRHSDVAVTRDAYIDRDAVDPRSLAAMAALQTLICNQYTTTAPEAQIGVVVQ
ncbi:MAG TPA: tyrosine-type recombinase/integrase [Acidobacteriaceae bacterium]|nr:tyrosine-type recombinase/integrase [Acidobacteriaceae bacterium]